MEECHRLLQQVVADQPAASRYQSDLGTILCILGSRLADRGRTQEARDAFQQSREIYRKLREKSPGEGYEGNVREAEEGLAKLAKNSKSSRDAPAGSGGTPTQSQKPAGAGVR